MTKIISFTGSQGSGKTTMRKIIVERLEKLKHSVLSDYEGINVSISRDAAAEGFALNEGTNFEAQYYMASKYISADLLTRKKAELEGIDYIITDRSVIDVIPYTIVSPVIMYKERQIISNMLITHLNLYPVDLMVLCSPISRLEHDGLRSTNKKFSEEIHIEFAKLMLDSRFESNLPKNLICTLENDTIENRVKKVVNSVDWLQCLRK